MSKRGRIHSLTRCEKEAPGVHTLYDGFNDVYFPCGHCWSAKKRGLALCASCCRAEGCPDNFGGDVPMGPLSVCSSCTKPICPVCESDGCACAEDDQ